MSSRLRFVPFGSPDDPLVPLSRTRQGTYLVSYLAHLGASTVLRESLYFDRDYLAEFSAFYGVSSRGYPNTCERLHFFSGTAINRDNFRRAAAGHLGAVRRLQEAYLGFTVIRPIPSAPFGRTAFRWYPENTPTTPRVTQPSREYSCHVAGVTLTVTSLAWQQQDAGVGACATVALWTMLHSSAFDDHHAIPTTADITRHAHKTASLGARVFPSSGLTIHQVCEAIKECGLAPVVAQGDIDDSGQPRFSRRRFAALSATLIRSGYPVLLLGEYQGAGRHAVCIVGFRDRGASIPAAGQVELQDEATDFFYIHDDNIGPSARFAVHVTSALDFVSLQQAQPSYIPSSLVALSTLVPSHLIAAMHEDVRISPDMLHARTLGTADTLRQAYENLRTQGAISGPPLGLTVGTKIMKLHQYLGEGLDLVLPTDSRVRSRTRLFLSERAPPMSLHIGIGRIGWGPTPLVDLIFDTTDSGYTLPCFCHLAFHPMMSSIAGLLHSSGILDLGTSVECY